MVLGTGFNTFSGASLGYNLSAIMSYAKSGFEIIETINLAEYRRLVTLEVKYKSYNWKKSLHINSGLFEKFIKVTALFNYVKTLSER